MKIKKCHTYSREPAWELSSCCMNLTRDHKKKERPHIKSWACLFQHNNRLSETWKKASCFTLLKRITRLKRWSQEPRPAVSHYLNELPGSKRWGQELQHIVQHIDRQGENRKKANCFTLLKRITRLKIVNSEIKSEDQNSYLDRYSPKGSCHHDETGMSHTLAQNCRCEFGCGATIKWHDEYTYKRIITVDVGHIKQQR